MPAEPRGGVAQALCRTLLRAAPDLTDGQLLDRFLAGREEAAFEALVRRHGPMVFGVCRRVLGNAADADDAFQATFVVLVRKARTLAGRGTVGDFLYGVAYHTALKARAQAVKRRAKEARAAVPDRPDADPAEHNELLRLLDRELARLPAKYREPVVLCDLEGRPRAEVAGLLGIPEGTLSSRLTTARRTLADRLGRHGLAVSAGAVAAALGRSAEAGVPGPLVGAAVRAAGGVVPAAVAHLASEVSKMMLLGKLKAGAAGFAVVTLLGAAIGLAAAQDERPAAKPEPPAKAAARPAAKPDEPEWRKEFRKVYGLADGEVLKRVPPPYPDSRHEFLKSVYGESGQTPYEHRFTVFRWRDGRVDPNKITMQVPVKPDEGATLSTVLAFVANLTAQMVEGNPDLLNARVTGDFVVRDGADPVRVVARLERILRDECKLPVALAFEHVEQDVVVARGKFASKPLDGRKPNHVEIFAQSVLDPAQNGSGGSGPDTLPKFLQHLGSYINRRIVNEVEQPPGRVSWTNNLRGMIIRDPARGIDTDAEDRDPDAVLRNVAAQTGLTFKTEKRTVRVLFVRKLEERQYPKLDPAGYEKILRPEGGEIDLREQHRAEVDALRRLRGTWEVTKVVTNGQDGSLVNEQFVRWHIDEGKVRVEAKSKWWPAKPWVSNYKLKVNPTVAPKEMTVFGNDLLTLAIYEQDGDALRVCKFSPSDAERPRGFDPATTRVGGYVHTIYVFKRTGEKP